LICVDASVAAKWVLDEPLSDMARALYDDASANEEPTVAPSLLPIEMTNILWQRVRRGLLTMPQADEALARFLAFPITLALPASLHRDALFVSSTYLLPATYDAHYVALAQQLGATLWTDDQQLVKALDGQLGFVRALSDYR
jgi:predicted nucleic acid-binding protein